jgi:hypothetical protein
VRPRFGFIISIAQIYGKMKNIFGFVYNSSYICSAIGIDGNHKSNKMNYNPNFVRAFQIFKEGQTPLGWVTILIHIEEFNDETLNRKLAWYKYLGFQIKDIID